MAATLHPVVDRLLNSGLYSIRPHVELFTEHELKNGKGEVTARYTKDDLEQIAHVCNAKAANGCLSPIAPGHTYDDVYDDAGQLVRKFPEENQPEPLGYGYNYRVEHNPHTNKYCLYYDEHVQRVITDPKTGERADGMAYSASFPRRSAEIYPKERWIDFVALLRRAPRLDLALELYSKNNPDKTYYARTRDGDAPVAVMARGKLRYSMETAMDDPTKPPTAAPSSPSAAPSPSAPAAGAQEELPPEHQEYAHALSTHMHGMHHSRVAPLMKKMHEMYAAQCGMTGDMHTPYAMGIPGAAAVMPQVSPAAQPAPTTEHAKMQQDQVAIQHERYERRIADLEAKAAAAEAKELETHMRYELQQMVAEGFGIDAAAELKFATDRRYSRTQFDDHVQVLRRTAQKDPTGRMPPLNDFGREFRIPGPAAPPTNEMSETEFAKAHRYSRQHPDLTWEQVKERYNKPEARNGAVK